MRRAFTLVELLVVVAIMGIMVTVGVISLTSGESAARVKGAVRDVYAAIRHARSTALVTKQPSVVTYSTATVDGVVVARVEIHASKLIDTTSAEGQVETVTGQPVDRPGDEGETAPAPAKSTAAAKSTALGKGGEAETADEAKGEAIEDIFFAPVDDSVVKGMRLKVVMGEELAVAVAETRKPKISVFSNVDYLLSRFKDAKKAAEAEAQKTADADDAKAGSAAKDQEQEPVSVVWDTNGRVEPHQVWVYPDGKTPEDGMLVRIDRFGGVKVLSGTGKEED